MKSTFPWMQRHYVNYYKGEQLYETNRRETNRNYSAILATLQITSYVRYSAILAALQITSYALGV
jgi:hypothetical protein